MYQFDGNDMHRNTVKHSNRDTEAQQEIDQLKKVLMAMLWRLGETHL